MVPASMRSSILGLLLLAGCPHGHGGTTAPPPPPESAEAGAVRASIEPLYEEGILQGGTVIALVEPGKDPQYLRFGHTSPTVADPPGADSIFEIGSISKVLTGLLLQDSIARGEVTLDTTAQQLMPLGTRFPDGGGIRPTLGDLVSHRAGLPVLPDNLDPTAPDPYAGYTEGDLEAYLDQAQLQIQPGTQYAYSNLGAGILGWLLSRKLGTTYEQAVKTRVLSPLGLASTMIKVPDALSGRLVPGTTQGGQPAEPWSFDVLAGAGAWRSTPADMAALVSTAAAASAGKDVPLADVLRASFQPLGDAGNGMQIATAWHITDGGVVWHNGMTGGYAAYIGFDPATQKGVVVMMSTATALVTKIGMSIFDAFAGKPIDLGLDIVTLPEDKLARLAGSYQLQTGDSFQVELDDGALYIVANGDKARLYPRSETEFLLLELSTTLDFVIDGDTVRGFVLHLPQGDVQAVKE
jgi:D-alanyl-D-alanine-carboxypeptidase/D-alanyl-D-alanine-endopeptidase